MRDRESELDTWQAVQELLDSSAAELATPEEVLARMSRLSALERLARIALQHTADRGRELGTTWQELGEAAGATAPNAHKRWHTVRAADRDDPDDARIAP